MDSADNHINNYAAPLRCTQLIQRQFSFEDCSSVVFHYNNDLDVIILNRDVAQVIDADGKFSRWILAEKFPVMTHGTFAQLNKS